MSLLNTTNIGFEICNATTGSKIFLSICPLLLAFGTCTNILSLLVLTRKRMIKHSTYSYLAILSVVDLTALHLGLIRDYLAHGFGIYMKSAFLCKIHSFLFYYTLDFSSWILVAVSVDRFLAITFVFSSYTRHLLLKFMSKPKIICSFIGFCLFLLNLHFIVFVDVSENFVPNHIDNTEEFVNNSRSIGVSAEYLYCVINKKEHPKYTNFFFNVWPYIDLSAYAILPFCIMSICNVAIIKNAKFLTPISSIARIKNKKCQIKTKCSCFSSPHSNNIKLQDINLARETTNYDSIKTLEAVRKDKNLSNVRANFIFSTSTNKSMLDNQNSSSHKNTNSKLPKALSFASISVSTSYLSSQARNIRMMTITIISVTCIFILLTLPIMVFIVFEKIATSNEDQKNNNGSSFHISTLLNDRNCNAIIWSILNIFMYLNHSINFLLYCLTGSKFRAELASIFISPQTLVNSTSEQVNFSTAIRYSSVKYQANQTKTKWKKMCFSS